MVCHEAIGSGPCSRSPCRLSRLIIASSLPDIRPTRDPSRPGCLSADDANDPQLVRPVLAQYSPFIVLPLFVRPPHWQGIAHGPRGRPYRPDSRCQQLAYESDRPDANAVQSCQVFGVLRGATARPCGPCQPVVPIGCWRTASGGRLGPVSAALACREGRSHWQSALSSAVVLPRPDLVAGAGCQSVSGASTMVESQQWLKAKCVSVSSSYPVSANLIHWALLAAAWSAGAELNNENNAIIDITQKNSSILE